MQGRRSRNVRHAKQSPIREHERKNMDTISQRSVNLRCFITNTFNLLTTDSLSYSLALESKRDCNSSNTSLLLLLVRVFVLVVVVVLLLLLTGLEDDGIHRSVLIDRLFYLVLIHAVFPLIHRANILLIPNLTSPTNNMRTPPLGTDPPLILLPGLIPEVTFATDIASSIRCERTEWLTTEVVARNRDDTCLTRTFVPAAGPVIELCCGAMKNCRSPGVAAAEMVFVSIAHFVC